MHGIVLMGGGGVFCLDPRDAFVGDERDILELRLRTRRLGPERVDFSIKLPI